MLFAVAHITPIPDALTLHHASSQDLALPRNLGARTFSLHTLGRNIERVIIYVCVRVCVVM